MKIKNSKISPDVIAKRIKNQREKFGGHYMSSEGRARIAASTVIGFI
jgi:hypothetical protein